MSVPRNKTIKNYKIKITEDNVSEIKISRSSLNLFDVSKLPNSWNVVNSSDQIMYKIQRTNTVIKATPENKSYTPYKVFDIPSTILSKDEDYYISIKVTKNFGYSPINHNAAVGGFRVYVNNVHKISAGVSGQSKICQKISNVEIKNKLEDTDFEIGNGVALYTYGFSTTATACDGNTNTVVDKPYFEWSDIFIGMEEKTDDEPYKATDSSNVINFSTPLNKGDVLDFESGILEKGTGGIELIQLPTITTFDDATTVFEVSTPGAELTEVEYY